jgi:multiple sugar transport system substrate-binding protein
MRTRGTRRKVRPHLVACVAAIVAAVIIAGCGGSSSSSSGNKKLLTIAYGSTYVFATPQLGKEYYDKMAKDFEALHPGVTVKIVGIPGGPSDVNDKLSLLYRSPSTAPTIAQIDAGDINKFASAGYLLPLNSYLGATSWWSHIPPVVQNEAKYGGTVYGVNQGENTQAILYNKADFRKAGLPVSWHPKTWQDIINAALVIKHKIPGLTPIWAEGGTSEGTVGAILGVGNLLAGTSDPTIYDPTTKKWIVNSPGLKQTFTFIHEITKDGLGAPVSELFNSNAAGNSLAYMKSPGVAIALASNYWGSGWLKNNAPNWPQASKLIGFAPLPTSNGQGSDVATLLAGTDQAVYKDAPNKKLAFELLNFLMQKNNLLAADNDGGWIPPVTTYDNAPLYDNYGAPFQKEFAELEKDASEWPTSQNLNGWAQGFEQATGALEQSSSTTVAQAMQTMQQYAQQYLGASAVQSNP